MTQQLPHTAGAALNAAPAVARVMLSVVILGSAAVATGILPPAAARDTHVRVRPEAPVTAMNRSIEAANNSPTLLADPTDSRFVVLANRLDGPDYSCALQASGDSGRSWRTVTPVPTLPEGAEKCYAPEVAFDRSGTLHYLFVGLAGGGNAPMGAFLTTSSDRGRNFSAPRRVLGPHEYAVRMAIDREHGSRGRIHLVWLHATTPPALGGYGPPPNPILSAYSDDGGNSFSQPAQVSDPTRRVVAPVLALGPDRRVHIAYYDLESDAVDYQGLEGPVYDGTWSLVMRTSTDGGASFDEGAFVERSIVPWERVMLIFTMPPPSVAVGEGRLCVGWPDARHGDADVLVRCSSNGGRTWAPARRANDDQVDSGARQYLPRLSFAPNGRLDVAFYDRRDTREHLATSVYYSYSRDGGRSFAPNVKLTKEPMDPRIGPRYLVKSARGQVEFGSRLALLSQRDTVLVAWTDTLNSRPRSAAQDIFLTEVALPSSGRRPGWKQLLGAGSLAGAGLILVVSRRRRSRRKEQVREPVATA
ncbi:MAG TPA: sialidase family protein [Acidimicrobiales bacterium]|nr:sialidase family protein [Acidimicrobiales bacterium]